MDLMVDNTIELLSTFLDVIIVLWLCGEKNPYSQEIHAEVFRYLQFLTGSSKEFRYLQFSTGSSKNIYKYIAKH